MPRFSPGTVPELRTHPVLIRPATAADLAAIKGLERETATAAHWSAEQYSCLFETSAGTIGRRIVLVVEEPWEASGRGKPLITGFLIAQDVGSEWEVENLVVDAKCRRRGLGRHLIHELIAQAQVAGAVALFLEVRESNAPARALYHSAGFAETGRRKDYYTDPVEPALVYRLTL